MNFVRQLAAGHRLDALTPMQEVVGSLVQSECRQHVVAGERRSVGREVFDHGFHPKTKPKTKTETKNKPGQRV